jgi:hypothetical protein
VTNPQTEHKAAFASYVHEDGDHVTKMSGALEAASIPVWRDKEKLGPGDSWKAKIRDAIRSGSMVFPA